VLSGKARNTTAERGLTRATSAIRGRELRAAVGTCWYRGNADVGARAGMGDHRNQHLR